MTTVATINRVHMPQKRPVHSSVSRTSGRHKSKPKNSSGSKLGPLLPIVVIFAVLAVLFPKAHAMVRGFMAPITVAEDVHEISTGAYLYSIGCGYPKPSPETVAKGYQINKVSPWGYQYSLVAGGRNTLWVCLGCVPERHRESVETMFKEQKRPTAEQDDLFYVMCDRI